MINMTNTLKWADAPSEHPFELAAITVMVWDKKIKKIKIKLGNCSSWERNTSEIDEMSWNTWIFAALEKNVNQEALYSSHMACDQGIAKLPVCDLLCFPQPQWWMDLWLSYIQFLKSSLLKLEELLLMMMMACDFGCLRSCGVYVKL